MHRLLILPAAFAAVSAFAAPPAAAGTNAPPQEAAVFKGNTVVVPSVSSSPGFGSGLGLMGMYFLPREPGREAPDSMLMAMFQYSDTDSYFAGVFGSLYSGDDTWRIRPGIIRGRINSSLDIPGYDTDVRYENDIRGAVYRQERRLHDAWFGGFQLQLIDSDYTAKNAAAGDYFEALGVEDTTSLKAGLILSWDNREHQHYPTEGLQGELSLNFAPEGATDENGYTTVEGFLSSFFPVTRDQVIGIKLNGKTVSSNAPFFERPTLGQRGDLRGYTPGEVVGDHLASLQGEWRAFFHPMIGGVLFGGGAAIWNDGESPGSDNLYWSYGLGLRIRLHAENRINFRVDYAWGEDDQSGFYLGMQEAF